MDPKRISTSPMLQDPTTFNAIGILIDYTIGKDLETYSLKNFLKINALAQKFCKKYIETGFYRPTKANNSG